MSVVLSAGKGCFSCKPGHRPSVRNRYRSALNRPYFLTERIEIILLVNVGPHTIYVEQALAFEDDGDAVRIIFAADGNEDGRYCIELEGKQAERMRAWLDRNAEGVRGSERAGFHIESEG